MTRLDPTGTAPGAAFLVSPDAAPFAVVDLELADGVRDRDVTTMPSPQPLAHDIYRAAYVLVRLHGDPVGTFQTVLDEANLLTADAQRAGIASGSHAALRARGLDVTAVLAGDLPAPTTLDAGALAGDIAISVVICTRDHPDAAMRTVHSLQQQEFAPARILVVDNAPTSDETRRLVLAAAESDPRVEYLLEARPGLSWARNAGLRAVSGGYIAWIDDDEVADPRWTLQLAAAFASQPGAAAASGSVVPGELETPAQWMYESYGGHTKGRGFVAETFRLGAGLTQSPLFPLPAFGVGANMAFDVAQLRSMGGFDVALGAGTLSRSCEETLVFTELLLSGRTVLYTPNALVRHNHRRTYAELRTQMIGYGYGLTAFYTALAVTRPSVLWALLKLLPFAVRDVLSPSGSRLSDVPAEFPPDLIRAKNLAMLRGPFAYLRARLRARRLRSK